MAKNHTFLFSFMVVAMALMLQSQTGGCCSTPNPPSQTPTAIGTLYLPRLQPANPLYQNTSCNGSAPTAPFFQLNLPTGGTIYPLDVDIASTISFWFKVKVTSIDGCYIQNTYLNPTDRSALNGKGIRINYPTNQSYVVEVWAQINGVFISCDPNILAASPEWYCKFANNENSPQLFNGGNTANPADITLHPFVKDGIIFSFNNGGNGNGTIEPKFKFNGNVPFGTNVLN